MGKRGFSVSRAADVIGSARAALKGRDERILLLAVVDPACPRDLVLEARRLLVAERPGCQVEVRSLAQATPSLEALDLVVLLAGSEGAGPVAASFARAGIPVALVVEGALDAPVLELPEHLAALVRVVACSSPASLSFALGAHLAQMTDKPLALAANFAFCRPAVCEALVTRCAAENALVGALGLIPGSDLPVMVVNQAKLALDIAAAHGRDLEPSRLAELAGVMAAGLGWRAAARALLSAIPALGFVARAGMGFAGTYATGSALRLRFEAESLLARRAAQPAAPERTPQAQPAALLATAPDDGYVIIEGSGS